MKKIASIALAAILLITLLIPAAAAASVTPSEKEEVVYGILGSDGSVQSLYVVNIFDAGNVVDFGNYTDVKNLTNTDPVTQNGDEITITSSAERLYYQGTLKNPALPWDIAVTYTLNGITVPPSTLAGADGALTIHIKAAQNSGADSTFFNNYALQIGLSLDTTLCENIMADGATVADAGTDKQLSYIALPGKGADITVTADVHDFEMDAMTINGIKLALNLDVDDTEFSSQLTELTDAIADLDGGAADLLDGVRQLGDGMLQYLSGLKTYETGLGDLSGGASQLAAGISGLADGLGALASQGDALAAGAQSIQQAAFDAVNAQLSGMGLPELTPDNYSAVLSGNDDLAAVKAQLDGAVQFTQGVTGYTAGVSQLHAGANDLSSGANNLSSGLNQAAAGAKDLYDGAAQLSAAVSSLRDGLAQYKDGTAQLKDGTKDMDGEIANQIDKLLSEISGGDTVKSFVSDKNTNVSAVQFVLKTAAIEIPETDSTAVVQEKEPTFWDRLLALFGIV